MAERPARPAREHGEGGAPKAPPEPKRTDLPAELEPMASLVRAELGGLVEDLTHAAGDVIVYVPAERIQEASRICHDSARLRMDYLRCLSGVDYIEYFEVVYHLYSIPLKHKLALKVRLPHDQPAVKTVTGIWRSANWHERELQEMFAIKVEGHPDPRPLLLEEDVDEHPLLKSHPLVEIGADRPGIVAAPADSPDAYAGGAWTRPATRPDWLVKG